MIKLVYLLMLSEVLMICGCSHYHQEKLWTPSQELILENGWTAQIEDGDGSESQGAWWSSRIMLYSPNEKSVPYEILYGYCMLSGSAHLPEYSFFSPGYRLDVYPFFEGEDAEQSYSVTIEDPAYPCPWD